MEESGIGSKRVVKTTTTEDLTMTVKGLGEFEVISLRSAPNSTQKPIGKK